MSVKVNSHTPTKNYNELEITETSHFREVLSPSPISVCSELRNSPRSSTRHSVPFWPSAVGDPKLTAKPVCHSPPWERRYRSTDVSSTKPLQQISCQRYRKFWTNLNIWTSACRRSWGEPARWKFSMLKSVWWNFCLLPKELVNEFESVSK